MGQMKTKGKKKFKKATKIDVSQKIKTEKKKD